MRSLDAEIAKFNRDYAEYAYPETTAYETYRKMMKDGFFQIDIAAHFHVHENTVSLWNKRFSMRPKVDSLSGSQE